MDEETGPAAYRIHVWIRQINPMIWRRLVVPSKSLADLHYAIQIAFAWTDYFGRRQVVASFDGGRISSDGGLLLLREAANRSGLLERFARCFTDYRDDRGRAPSGLR